MHETGRIPDAKALAICDVLLRHCRGVDRCDAAILQSAVGSDARGTRDANDPVYAHVGG